MSRVHNGPARNTPKGRTRLTSDTLAQLRTQMTVELDPTQCLCPAGPVTIGTFVEQRLVEVERRHLRSGGCGMASEHVEPRDYQADLRTRHR